MGEIGKQDGMVLRCQIRF